MNGRMVMGRFSRLADPGGEGEGFREVAERVRAFEPVDPMSLDDAPFRELPEPVISTARIWQSIGM